MPCEVGEDSSSLFLTDSPGNSGELAEDVLEKDDEGVEAEPGKIADLDSLAEGLMPLSSFSRAVSSSTSNKSIGTIVENSPGNLHFSIRTGMTVLFLPSNA